MTIAWSAIRYRLYYCSRVIEDLCALLPPNALAYLLVWRRP